MKLSWLFNGTMEAHHLLAAYGVVWVVQGGYALWILAQWRGMRRQDAIEEPSSGDTGE